MYPHELVDQVIKNWKVVQEKGKKNSPPKRKALLKILDVAFQASLTYDERRHTRFRLIFASPHEFRKHDERYSPYEELTAIPLRMPIELSSANIRRLAPATDPTRVLIGIEKRDGSDGELQIWGLVDAGSSWSDFLSHESSGGKPPPNNLIVSSNEPGHLSVSYGSEMVAAVREGSIVRPDSDIFRPEVVGSFFRRAHNRMYKEVCRELGLKRYSKTDDDWPCRAFNILIERILIKLNNRRHGGSILMLPSRWTEREHPWSSIALVKYPIEDNRLWGLLREDICLHREYHKLWFKLWDSKKPIGQAKFQKLSRMDMRRKDVHRAIRDAADLVVSLTGVDGSIVMTDQLTIIGFGAEVTTLAPALRDVLICHDWPGKKCTSVPIETFGTRHRAAFRYCWTFPEAVAFVASMDGGVRAVRRVGDNVLMWPDVTAEIFHS